MPISPPAGKPAVKRVAGSRIQLPVLHLSGSLNVACLLALRASRNIEIDALTFAQGLETAGLNRRKMSEKVFTTVIRRNEAKTLGIVEPLHATCCHILNLLKFTGHGP